MVLGNKCGFLGLQPIADPMREQRLIGGKRIGHKVIRIVEEIHKLEY